MGRYVDLQLLLLPHLPTPTLATIAAEESDHIRCPSATQGSEIHLRLQDARVVRSVAPSL